MVDLFWQSEAPDSLSKFCTMHRALFYREQEVPLVTPEPDPETYFDLSLTRPEEITFMLVGQPFGDTIYLSVLCGRFVIVPPFPLEDREHLPLLRPETV